MEDRAASHDYQAAAAARDEARQTLARQQEAQRTAVARLIDLLHIEEAEAEWASVRATASHSLTRFTPAAPVIRPAGSESPIADGAVALHAGATDDAYTATSSSVLRLVDLPGAEGTFDEGADGPTNGGNASVGGAYFAIANR
jgi:hypothetical protein